ncbi:MAG TPA: LysR family transcriptional regulator, partial [Burkholderiaceae bacterium]|nr:LysR family transcriptional regulator [Burkholderiaceae bacterium]
KLFVAIAEERSITHAAQRQNLVLSAASKRISDLETAINAPLLYRHARGVTLTPAGTSFLHYARQITHTLERMRGELSEYSKGVKGHIRIHANTSAIIQFLPEELNAFVSQHPQVKLDLEEQVSSAIIRSVSEGSADIGIFAVNDALPDLQIFPYHSDRLVVVVPDHHPLAHRKRLAFADTLAFDYVGLQADSSLTERLMAASMELDASIKLRIQVRSFDCMCRMIQANIGIGILPASAVAPHAKSMGLKAIPLKESWAARELKICVREFEALPVIARELVEHLSQPSET